MDNVVTQGKNVIKAHLEHLKEHNDKEHLKEAIDVLKEKGIEVPVLEEAHPAGHQHHHGTLECPGSKVMEFGEKREKPKKGKGARGESELRQWPVQIMLVPSSAPYLNDADLLIAADCVPFAYADFHHDLLAGKVLLVGCPKLDDAEFYKEKFTQIFKENKIKSITCAHMEVPCCFGLMQIIKEAKKQSGKDIPLKEITIGIKGEAK
jgi:hypothetical protein